MRIGLPAGVSEAIRDFDPVLKQLSVYEYESLFKALSEMTKCGVSGFGARRVDQEGNSAVFSTCNKWRSIPKNEAFHAMSKEHMNYEVQQVFQNEQKIVTRSGDKQESLYLQALNQFGLNNSLVRYQFTPHDIQIFFFIASSPDERDLILNNMDYLDCLVNSIEGQLDKISRSKTFVEQKKPLLTEESVDFIWNRSILSGKKRGKIKVHYAGKDIYLSQREAQIFVMLGFGFSNKTIANRLTISDLTVKDYTAKLRAKFQVNCRDNLSLIAMDPEVKYLRRFIGEIV